jgi:hypothetical protein
MGLEGNPLKGQMPEWELAKFTTHDGLRRVWVWFNCNTGLTEVTECERTSLDASWGSANGWKAIG